MLSLLHVRMKETEFLTYILLKRLKIACFNLNDESSKGSYYYLCHFH